MMQEVIGDADPPPCWHIRGCVTRARRLCSQLVMLDVQQGEGDLVTSLLLGRGTVDGRGEGCAEGPLDTEALIKAGNLILTLTLTLILI